MTAFRDDPLLPARVDAIEAAAWASLAGAAAPEDGFDIETAAGVTLAIHPARERANRVYGLGLAHPGQADIIDSIIRQYRGHGIRSFELYLCPVARPSTLRRLLQERGFRLASREAVLFRPTPEASGADPFFQIRSIRPEEAARLAAVLVEAGVDAVLAKAIARSPGRPGWQSFMAFDGKSPYAAGGFFVQGDGAWISPIHTLPALRGRGTESAMLAYALSEARKLGCRWATTSFDLGLRARPRNFARNGFELLYIRSRHVWREATEYREALGA